MHAFAGGHALD